jgi:hypothetical protein
MARLLAVPEKKGGGKCINTNCVFSVTWVAFAPGLPIFSASVCSGSLWFCKLILSRMAGELTQMPIESSFELERIKRSIDTIDDSEMLRQLAKSLAEMLVAQETVYKRMVGSKTPI